MKIYFTSDPHFGHFNILKYEPTRMEELAYFIAEKMHFLLKDYTEEAWFDSALEYVNRLISSEDPEDRKEILQLHDNMIIDRWNKVVKSDDVVWILGDFSFYNKEKSKELLSKLKGIKKIVLGNHDHHSTSWFYDVGFAYVSDYPIVWSNDYILSHEPTESGDRTNIYGHIHLHNSEDVPTYQSKSICVCLERQNFTPKTLKQLLIEKEKLK